MGGQPAFAEFGANYLYNLSDFAGTVRYGQVRLYADRLHDEVYVADGDSVRIFNRTGMEVYRFGDDQEIGSIYGMAVDEAGDIYTLSYDLRVPGILSYYLCRCNYRGEPREKIAVSNLPEGYADFEPNTLIYRNDRFFLVSTTRMKAVVTDKRGAFVRAYDFADIVGIPEKDRPSTELFGITLDEAGDIFLTVPAFFKVYRISPNGKVASFGKPGGAPGFFGVVSGIAVDSAGNILVSDKLKSVVMVFDKDFTFLTQFGFRDGKPGSLAGPTDLALGNVGRLYVTQLQRRGISVFSLTSN